MQYNDDAVLNSIYRNAETAQTAIFDLIPKVEHAGFLSDIRTQQAEYSAISAEAVSQLSAMGKGPEPVNRAKKLGMKMGVEMNTMLQNDVSHLAQLMIKGSNMGIINMTKVLNDYPNPKPEVKGLADRLIQAEHQNLERLKVYL